MFSEAALVAAANKPKPAQTQPQRKVLWVFRPTIPFTHDYTLGELIGGGAYGKVYKCTPKLHPHATPPEYAVKIISKHHFRRDLDLFRHEITIMKLLDHPNLIKFINCYENEVYLYIVMEYCSADLFSLLTTHFPTEINGIDPRRKARLHHEKKMANNNQNDSSDSDYSDSDDHDCCCLFSCICCCLDRKSGADIPPTDNINSKEAISLANSTYSERDVADWIYQIALGLDYLHQRNIVHADLKPENVMVIPQPKQPSKQKNDKIASANSRQKRYTCKIIDFGLSSIVQRRHIVNSQDGSPEYMSREVVNGQYTIHSDMWSLGVLMYNLLYGFTPFMAYSVVDTLKLIQTDGFRPTQPTEGHCNSFPEYFINNKQKSSKLSPKPQFAQQSSKNEFTEPLLRVKFEDDDGHVNFLQNRSNDHDDDDNERFKPAQPLNGRPSVQDLVIEQYSQRIPRVSSYAKDLICRLLVADPLQRLSAKEVLQHPWFTAKKLKYNVLNTSTLKPFHYNSQKTKLKRLLLLNMIENLDDDDILNWKKRLVAFHNNNALTPQVRPQHRNPSPNSNLNDTVDVGSYLSDTASMSSFTADMDEIMTSNDTLSTTSTATTPYWKVGSLDVIKLFNTSNIPPNAGGTTPLSLIPSTSSSRHNSSSLSPLTPQQQQQPPQNSLLMLLKNDSNSNINKMSSSNCPPSDASPGLTFDSIPITASSSRPSPIIPPLAQRNKIKGFGVPRLNVGITPGNENVQRNSNNIKSSVNASLRPQLSQTPMLTSSRPQNRTSSPIQDGSQTAQFSAAIGIVDPNFTLNSSHKSRHNDDNPDYIINTEIDIPVEVDASSNSPQISVASSMSNPPSNLSATVYQMNNLSNRNSYRSGNTSTSISTISISTSKQEGQRQQSQPQLPQLQQQQTTQPSTNNKINQLLADISLSPDELLDLIMSSLEQKLIVKEDRLYSLFDAIQTAFLTPQQRRKKYTSPLPLRGPQFGVGVITPPQLASYLHIPLSEAEGIVKEGLEYIRVQERLERHKRRHERHALGDHSSDESDIDDEQDTILELNVDQFVTLFIREDTTPTPLPDLTTTPTHHKNDGNDNNNNLNVVTNEDASLRPGVYDDYDFDSELGDDGPNHVPGQYVDDVYETFSNVLTVDEYLNLPQNPFHDSSTNTNTLLSSGSVKSGHSTIPTMNLSLTTPQAIVSHQLKPITTDKMGPQRQGPVKIGTRNNTTRYQEFEDSQSDEINIPATPESVDENDEDERLITSPSKALLKSPSKLGQLLQNQRSPTKQQTNNAQPANLSYTAHRSHIPSIFNHQNNTNNNNSINFTTMTSENNNNNTNTNNLVSSYQPQPISSGQPNSLSQIHINMFVDQRLTPTFTPGVDGSFVNSYMFNNNINEISNNSNINLHHEHDLDFDDDDNLLLQRNNNVMSPSDRALQTPVHQPMGQPSLLTIAQNRRLFQNQSGIYNDYITHAQGLGYDDGDGDYED